MVNYCTTRVLWIELIKCTYCLVCLYFCHVLKTSLPTSVCCIVKGKGWKYGRKSSCFLNEFIFAQAVWGGVSRNVPIWDHAKCEILICFVDIFNDFKEVSIIMITTILNGSSVATFVDKYTRKWTLAQLYRKTQ